MIGSLVSIQYKTASTRGPDFQYLILTHSMKYSKDKISCGDLRFDTLRSFAGAVMAAVANLLCTAVQNLPYLRPEPNILRCCARFHVPQCLTCGSTAVARNSSSQT